MGHGWKNCSSPPADSSQHIHTGPSEATKRRMGSPGKLSLAVVRNEFPALLNQTIPAIHVLTNPSWNCRVKSEPLPPFPLSWATFILSLLSSQSSLFTQQMRPHFSLHQDKCRSQRTSKLPPPPPTLCLRAHLLPTGSSLAEQLPGASSSLLCLPEDITPQHPFLCCITFKRSPHWIRLIYRHAVIFLNKKDFFLDLISLENYGPISFLSFATKPL